MANMSSLTDRIDAEFAQATKKVGELQAQRVQELKDRQQRLESLEKTLDGLRELCRPRLEALAKRFADKVKVTPSVSAGSRLATFQFQSELARIDLQFSVLDRCLQLHGGYGYMEEYPIARMWRDGRVQRIYGGTNEIMRDIVGRALGV